MLNPAGRRLLRVVFALLLSCAFALCVVGQEQDFSRRDLIQPFVGDEHSQWMIGAVSHVATEAEIEEFASLRSAEQAQQFIERFWEARRESGAESSRMRDLFETRALAADDRYTEGHVQGRRTDRGAVFILYGQPDSSEYEEFRDISEPDVELWKYSKKSPKGLDGKKPGRMYRFARQGDVTRMYRRPSAQELERRARTRAPF